MRIVLAQYKGHINNNFIFAVNKQNIIFMPHEITVIDMPLMDLIRLMQKEINSWYKLSVFWDPYGYYVMKNKNGKYDLYDALTNINTGTTMKHLNQYHPNICISMYKNINAKYYWQKSVHVRHKIPTQTDRRY